MPERLQKLISEAGLMSRRAAEKLIAEGRVTVNGRIAFTGEKADLKYDTVLVDGQKLIENSGKTYVMLNKPKGFVTTMSDEKGRKNVSMLVADVGTRIYPVGRLDLNSEGLLVMTNDGEFANRLMHPSNQIWKTYEVRVNGDDIPSSIERLRDPIEIDGSIVKAKEVELTASSGRNASLLITIGEGKNREVRKMCASVGLKVSELRRIKEGDLSLGDLKTGHWRYLTQQEIRSIFRNDSDYGQK